MDDRVKPGLPGPISGKTPLGRLRPALAALLLVAAGCFAAGGTDKHPATRKAETAARLQAELDRTVRESGIPGASLAVAYQDGTVITLASGQADRETGEALTPRHRLFTGSVGKTYAAALALRLCAAGRLSLDDPVKKHLGRFPWYKRLPNANAITVRNLLEHATGIPEHVRKPELWQRLRKDPDRTLSMPEALSYSFDDPPLFAPGAQFSYADTNFILLGMIIESVTGRPFYREAQRVLLGPLGLADTIPADRRTLPGLAAGYSEVGEPFSAPGKVTERGTYYINPAIEWTGGGYITTPADLARWSWNLYAGDVLPLAWRKAMTTDSGRPTDLPGGAGYGLGCFVWTSPLGPAFGHSGFVPGYNTVTACLPEKGFAVAMQCNSDVAFRKMGESSVSALNRFLRLVDPPAPVPGPADAPEPK